MWHETSIAVSWVLTTNRSIPTGHRLIRRTPWGVRFPSASAWRDRGAGERYRQGLHIHSLPRRLGPTGARAGLPRALLLGLGGRRRIDRQRGLREERLLRRGVNAGCIDDRRLKNDPGRGVVLVHRRPRHQLSRRQIEVRRPRDRILLAREAERRRAPPARILDVVGPTNALEPARHLEERCTSVPVDESIVCFAAAIRPITSRSAMTQPTRRPGRKVFEKLPIETTS